jgi:hypothetical protein
MNPWRVFEHFLPAQKVLPATASGVGGHKRDAHIAGRKAKYLGINSDLDSAETPHNAHCPTPK